MKKKSQKNMEKILNSNSRFDKNQTIYFRRIYTKDFRSVPARTRGGLGRVRIEFTAETRNAGFRALHVYDDTSILYI